VTRPPSTALLLASGSSGRLAVLRAAGIDPEVLVSGVDETCDESMDTAAMVAELAERKASAVAALRPEALILGCDSLLDFEGEAVGKAGTPERAAAVWRRLAGNQGTLYTGHCLIEGSSGRRARAVTATTVRFGVPAEAELAAYIASGEPLAVAGAFTIVRRSDRRRPQQRRRALAADAAAPAGRAWHGHHRPLAATAGKRERLSRTLPDPRRLAPAGSPHDH
jgi:septum formation protein